MKIQTLYSSRKLSCLVAIAHLLVASEALSNDHHITSRRDALGWLAGGTTAVGGWLAQQQPSLAAGETPDSFNVDAYLRSGVVSSPMGVSGQAGKSKPETGIFLRDGSEVSRDPRTGDVLAEIVMMSSSGDKKAPVLASYSAPWPLATGTVFDVECRDPKTGDSAYLAVSSKTGGKAIGELKSTFFLDDLFAPTGRFSFYGQPTDVKVKSSTLKGDYREMDVTFATLSQSTQTEIPRRARVVATIPAGTDQAVMFVGSASALRWKKGSDQTIAKVADSFRAIPAPQTALKVRTKERRS
jgi:hypothetical protein